MAEMLPRVLLILLATLGTVKCLTISIVSNKFYDQDGNRFFIKGVSYQQQSSSSSVLTDLATCRRDVSLLTNLGANVIRVYSPSINANYDDCMALFNTAGIAVLVGLDSLEGGMTLSSTSTTWTLQKFQTQTAIMDLFAKYTNTMGFFVANEFITQVSETSNAPVIKAAIRDLKKYRNAQGYRAIPIGYSAADVASIRSSLAAYATCGLNAESADFLGLNSFAWCGDSSYTASGYNTLNSGLVNISVPIFFSEDGCTAVQPRRFTDQPVIFGSNMIDNWSGAVIYQWSDTTSNFGLVSISGNAVSLLTDYSALSSQWATLNPIGVPSASAATSITIRPQCPTTNANWLVGSNVALPTIANLVITSGTSSQQLPTLTAGSTGSTGSNGVDGTGQSSLSTGAKIGIGVAVPLAVLAVLAACFVLWRRRKASKSTSTGHAAYTDNHDSREKPELYAGDVSRGRGGIPIVKSELPNSTETPMQHQPYAYGGQGPSFRELEASDTRQQSFGYTPQESVNYMPQQMPSWHELSTAKNTENSSSTEIGTGPTPSVTMPKRKSVPGMDVGDSVDAVGAAEATEAAEAAEADAAVQQLGLIATQKRALAAYASSQGKRPEDLDGTRGQLYRSLLESETATRARLEEMDQARRH